MGCLYMLTSPSGKRYIGITRQSFEDRWATHVRDSQRRRRAISSAIRKYGAGSIDRRVLLFADDWAFLCEMEKRAIARYGTKAPRGYNCTQGGDGAVGLDDASRELHRERTAGGTRRAWAEGRMDARAITTSDPEYQARWRASLSAAGKAAWADPAIREGRLAARVTEDYRRTVSASMTAKWADPEFRAARVATYRNRPKPSPETRRKVSESLKRTLAAKRAGERG